VNVFGVFWANSYCVREDPFPSSTGRTIGRAFGTMCRLSVCRLSVCNVLYCGKTVRPSEKLSDGVNRKSGSKSLFLHCFNRNFEG